MTADKPAIRRKVRSTQPPAGAIIRGWRHRPTRRRRLAKKNDDTMKCLTIFLTLAVSLPLAAAAKPADRPNIVIIFCDDLGYADVGCFGAKGYTTPNLDRLAAEGIRFTRFYDAQPVCSASRAALMTGCYPSRVGIMGALGPNSKVGISRNEVTLAEIVK